LVNKVSYTNGLDTLIRLKELEGLVKSLWRAWKFLGDDAADDEAGGLHSLTSAACPNQNIWQYSKGPGGLQTFWDGAKIYRQQQDLHLRGGTHEIHSMLASRNLVF
jgi:hypothetical protein